MVAPQALYLMNDPWVLDRIRQLSGRAASADVNVRIGAAYRRIHGRAPTADEMELGREFLTKEAPAAAPALGTWELYVQALVMSNEFMFVD
jgi:hypothetical protein